MKGRIRHGAAGDKVKRPAMPSASQLLPAALADAQRGSGMRTAVEPGEELVGDPTHQDGAAFDFNRFEAVLRQFFKLKNRDESRDC